MCIRDRYTDEQSAQIKAQADAVVEALAGGSSLEDAAKAAGTTATTGTYATYVDQMCIRDSIQHHFHRYLCHQETTAHRAFGGGS